MRGPRASICSLNGSSAKGGPARAARGIIWNPRYAYWLYVIRCLSPMSIGTLMETTQTRSCEFQLPFNILMFFWFLPTKSQHRQSCFGVNFHVNFGQTLLIPPSIRCRAVTRSPESLHLARSRLFVADIHEPNDALCVRSSVATAVCWLLSSIHAYGWQYVHWIALVLRYWLVNI